MCEINLVSLTKMKSDHVTIAGLAMSGTSFYFPVLLPQRNKERVCQFVRSSGTGKKEKQREIGEWHVLITVKP